MLFLLLETNNHISFSLMVWTKFVALCFSGTEAGASSDPCTDYYAGEYAFSENETRSLAEYFKSISDNLVGYLDFHSYSQLLMFPYGHTAEHVSNYDELVRYALLQLPHHQNNRRLYRRCNYHRHRHHHVSLYLYLTHKLRHFRKIWYTWDSLTTEEEKIKQGHIWI
jgi:hypothetical protein